MENLPNQVPFAKLTFDEAGSVVAWHPLKDHLIDVAACFARLCACRGIRRALERAAGRPLDVKDLARLAALAFLHDLGKANSGFQAKRWHSQQAMPRGWPPWAGHGSEALRLFDAESRLDPLLRRLPVEQLSGWGDGIFTLLHASLSHHGRPLPDPVGLWPRAIWQAVPGAYDPAETLQEIGRAVVTLFLRDYQPA